MVVMTIDDYNYDGYNVSSADLATSVFSVNFSKFLNHYSGKINVSNCSIPPTTGHNTQRAHTK